jgi:TetR/AcrR family transcriptional regulator
VETLEVRSADRILNSSLKLFSDKGYDATSVREICEAAGVTKPTLYHFYGSKEGVYRALVDGALARFRADLGRALAEPIPAIDRLRTVALTYFRAAREQRELVRFVFGLIYSAPSSAPVTDFTRFYRELVGLIAGVVEEGVARGELRPGPIDLRMLAFMGALGEAVSGSLICGEPALTDTLAVLLVDTVVEGWRTGGAR